eukprot:6468059-Amphidinium_carterae.1
MSVASKSLSSPGVKSKFTPDIDVPIAPGEIPTCRSAAMRLACLSLLRGQGVCERYKAGSYSTALGHAETGSQVHYSCTHFGIGGATSKECFLQTAG